jgi:hypothetical protein
MVSKENSFKHEPKFNGYLPSISFTKYSDYLNSISDDDLMDLNSLLQWNCFISDSKGRRFGSSAWSSKRIEPQIVPNKRIIAMNARFNLTDKSILEVGCFEGVHTLGLLQYTKSVKAVDSRMDHVVKTLVRCGILGEKPSVFKCDIESSDIDFNSLKADLLHHVGVLYHLKDPVTHLLDINKYISRGVMLDTHYCEPSEINGQYEVRGKSYSYKRYKEYGTKEAFSGMYDHSKWLLLDDIVNCLNEAGFGKVEIVEKRAERNGPRVLLYAERVSA